MRSGGSLNMMGGGAEMTGGGGAGVHHRGRHHQGVTTCTLAMSRTANHAAPLLTGQSPLATVSSETSGLAG
jgi:hypothetical protein